MASLSSCVLSLLGGSGPQKIYRVLASLFILALTIVTPVSSAGQDCLPESGCFTRARRDVIFLIDRSGSIARRGQTYNIEIEGVACALRDKTVIPRDGSTAVAVLLFSDTALISVGSDDPDNTGHIKGIDSDEQAESMAAAVEQLKCGNINAPA